MTNEELTAIYSTGNAASHEKGLRAVFEAGVAAGRPRAAVYAEREPIAKAGYEVVTEATMFPHPKGLSPVKPFRLSEDSYVAARDEPNGLPIGSPTVTDPDIVGPADETIDSAAPASRGRRGR